MSPRNCLASRSPSTQRKASITLDLPEPFGPTIAVTLSGNSKIVLPAKDLKPCNSKRRKKLLVLLIAKFW